MPEVRFGPPKDVSTEPFLTWWHIPVMVVMKRGWRSLVKPAELKHSRVILIFEGPTLRNALPLLWLSLEGLKETATLRVGKDPTTVPVVIRSKKECQFPFPLPAGVTRLTDQSMLLHRRAFTDLDPGFYQVRLRVQSERRLWDSQTYILSVPRPDVKNDRFRLVEVSESERSYNGLAE